MKNKNFVLKSGEEIEDLKGLCNALKSMDDDVYHHHVGESHNDFSCWVKDALCNEKCAIELDGAKTKDDAYEIVSKHGA